MRDPNRIEPLLKKLADAWHRVPDLRFAQFLMWFFGACPYDPFYIEDNYWEEALQAYLAAENPYEALKDYFQQNVPQLHQSVKKVL